MKFSINDIAFKHVHNYPDRPTLIFLHDSLGSIELWRDFPEKLGELTQCNILIYDRQGYGKSGPFSSSKRDHTYMEKEADILHNLIDHWKLKDVILFGHSDGGSIALITAGKYPKKIKCIVTEGAHIFVETVTLAGIKEAVQFYKTTNLKSKLEKYHGDKTEDMFWAWATTWLSEDFKTWNMESFLPFIECPSLIVQGENDEYGTLKQVQGILKATQGTSLKLILPKVKHTPHKEVPELMLKKANEFITGVLVDLKCQNKKFK